MGVHGFNQHDLESATFDILGSAPSATRGWWGPEGTMSPAEQHLQDATLLEMAGYRVDWSSVILEATRRGATPGEVLRAVACAHYYRGKLHVLRRVYLTHGPTGLDHETKYLLALAVAKQGREQWESLLGAVPDHRLWGWVRARCTYYSDGDEALASFGTKYCELIHGVDLRGLEVVFAAMVCPFARELDPGGENTPAEWLVQIANRSLMHDFPTVRTLAAKVLEQARTPYVRDMARVFDAEAQIKSGGNRAASIRALREIHRRYPTNGHVLGIIKHLNFESIWRSRSRAAVSLGELYQDVLADDKLDHLWIGGGK